MRPLRSSLHVSEALQLLCCAVDRGLSRRCAGDAAAKLNTKPSPEAEAVLHTSFSSRKFGGVYGDLYEAPCTSPKPCSRVVMLLLGVVELLR